MYIIRARGLIAVRIGNMGVRFLHILSNGSSVDFALMKVDVCGVIEFLLALPGVRGATLFALVERVLLDKKDISNLRERNRESTIFSSTLMLFLSEQLTYLQ